MRASRWALALVLALVGCADKAPPTAASSASASAPAPPAPPVRGLGAPGNDPALTAAVRKAVETCASAWKPDSGFDANCPDFKAFLAQKVDRGARDATLVAFLEDDEPKVRALGARGLAIWGDVFRVERPLAERVVAAAGRETAPALTGIMGFLAGEIVLEKAGLVDQIKELATRAEAPPDMQAGLISILLQANREDAAAFDLTRLVSDRASNVMVRNAALTAVSSVYDLRPADVCALWVQNRENAVEIIAATAAARLTAGASWVGYSGLAWSSTSSYTVEENRCAAEIAPTLAVIEARAKGGKIANENWIFALRGVLREDLKNSPAPMKQKALAVARLIAETRENNAGSRGSALRLVVERDPGGKAFAAKLAADPNAFVSTVAKEASMLPTKKK